MNRNLQNIEDLFRDGLEDNEEIPSVQVWDAIDNSLDKDNVVSIQKKYSSLKRVALLLLLLFLGLSIYELTNRHHNAAVVKKDNDHSNTATVSSRNDNGPILTYNNKSQHSVDSTSRDDREKENSTVNNSLIGKTIPGSKKQHDKSSQNIATHNLIAVKNISDNKSKLNNKFKPEIKNRSYSANNDIADNSIISKNKQRITTKARHKVKINSSKPTEDDQQAIVDNKPAQQFPSSERLNSAAIEKLDVRLLKESADADTKKLFKVPGGNKIIQSPDTKSTLALNKKTKKGKPSHFSATLFFSPDIAWYRLQEDKPNNQQNNTAEIENGEKHEFSSTFGALIDYRLSKHWSLQSGVNYSSTNITVEPKTIYAQTDNTGNIKYRINTSSGYGYILPSFSSNPVIGDSLYTFTATHTLQYIGIPLAIKYSIARGKFSFNTLVGVSANFLTKGKIEATVENGFNTEAEVVNNLQGLKKIYFAGLAGFGVEYNLNKKVVLSFVPTYRFALNSINKEVPVKSYPNSIGMAVGLKYNF